MSKLAVTAARGKTVNLRQSASSSSAVLGTVPVGAQVELIEKTSATWYHIKYNALEGYMMAKFLTSAEVSKEDLKKIYNSLSDTLKLIEQVLK